MGDRGGASGAPQAGPAPNARSRAAVPPARAAALHPNAATQLSSDERSSAATRDLQTLLSGAVQRLRAATGCAATAWALRDDASPYVAAAIFEGSAPQAPALAEFKRLAQLRGATDLTDRRTDLELQQLAYQHACHPAAPVLAASGEALALLLLHATGDAVRRRPPRGGALPPSWLGELDAACAQIAGPLSTALAIGRLRHLDHETRQLDRLASLGSLAAELAHELRNPLVAVKTFLDLLPEQRHDPTFLGEFCEVVQQELQRMQRLIETTLELALPDAPRPDGEPARAAVEVAAVGRLLSHRAARRGIVLCAEVPGDLPPLGLPADALRQVLLNLLQNAIDATPAGGRVRVTGRSGGPSECQLEICDEGPGVPPELAERIFEPFVTTRTDGAGGLGLAISRRIAEEAGGRLELDSPPGAGATLRLTLPACRRHGES